MKRFSFLFTLLLTLVLIVSCAPGSGSRVGVYDETSKPKEGQPAFPKLGDYWVVDNGDCFSQESVEIADAVFEKLRLDGIAEVAVICQRGVVNRGSMNDEKIWARDWGRWARLGDKEDQRAIVWLIRPDVKHEENRVTIEISRWLYWYTVADYHAPFDSALEEAANYANWDDLDGALLAISRRMDEKLRELWKQHKDENK